MINFLFGVRRGRTAPRRQLHKFLLAGLLGPFISLPAAALELPDPLTEADFIAVDRKQAELGRLLFYDKILSGNRNISCGTCHHHDLGGADGLSLGIGEGGEGIGPDRTPGYDDMQIHARIPRSAPPIWNLGHKSVTMVFHDGRLSVSDIYGNGFDSPAGAHLPKGLNSILAAQAMFPITSHDEMAGGVGENEIADAVVDGLHKGWPLIEARVRVVPGYGRLFAEAFAHIETAEDITIVDIANAIAAFEASEWRNHDSDFDAYLAGEPDALNDRETRGMELFFGAAECSSCHSGPLFTDQSFHALALPEFGPGKTRGWDPLPRDIGRMLKTDDLNDLYRFRTPSLRNVALTAPYGHNGAMPTLEAMIRHHVDPLGSLDRWTPDMARLPDVPWLQDADFALQGDSDELARLAARVDIDLPPLSERDISDIVAFLNCLTGRSAEARPLGRPDAVPSGLPVD
ncbi:cytochrome c peroxidase [Psychromarinibacter sp. C21-152]|uniref:Cytochrome c peroxidase n=1 Tax=Psychromarinibacter sediminicola TaxID=3033385 RepID=A0AAE3NNT6_9RHOB|nr:cytochrome c peroxidase [Psychromarinibacter sediminicola]MDF0601413.1 cytochrome c peroxidase [Psychromarinibacter sediminicola]